MSLSTYMRRGAWGGGWRCRIAIFFEHHSPLLYLLLAPILRLLKPETSYEAAIHAILLCRWIMWAISGLMLWLTYRLGKEMHGRAVGMMAMLFTLSTMMFVDRSTEIRPDMLSVPAMLGALLLTMRAFRGGVRRLVRLMAVAGLVAGLGVLASPKSVFWELGFGPAVLLAAFDRRSGIELRVRVKMVGALIAGAVMPMLVTLGVAALMGAGWHFVQYNFVLNSQWKFRLDPWETIRDLAYENPPIAALRVVGLVRVLVDAFWRSPSRWIRLIPRGGVVVVDRWDFHYSGSVYGILHDVDSAAGDL